MVLFEVRLRVILVVVIENGTLAVFGDFFARDVAIAFVTPVRAIVHAIAVPLLGDTLLVAYAFELIKIAELAVALVFAARTIADVIASGDVI